MAEFNVGDRVRCLGGCDGHSEVFKGKTGMVTRVSESGVIKTIKFDEKLEYCHHGNGDDYTEQSRHPNASDCFELIKSTNKIKIMNLVEKFKLSRMKEPEKSFVKAGIADTNGNLNSDGKTLFEAFLLEKHGAEFKKEVVDPILAEEEEAKK